MKRIIVLGTACLIGVMSYVPAGNATNINAELCDSTSGPLITLTSPLSDSVVDSSNIKLRGTTERTTQIDILLNGSYSSSLAIGSSQQIDTTVALAKGTNTISLQAYYSCNQTSSTTTLVITYEPAASPSNGSGISTSLPPEARQPTSSGSDSVDPSPPITESDSSEQDHNGNNAHPNSTDSPLNGSGSHQGEPASRPEWIPPAAVMAAVITPSLLLLAFEKVMTVIGIAGQHLPGILEWSIRGSGFILAGLLALLMYGAG